MQTFFLVQCFPVVKHEISYKPIGFSRYTYEPFRYIFSLATFSVVWYKFLYCTKCVTYKINNTSYTKL